jgi:hypothetical protein
MATRLDRYLAQVDTLILRTNGKKLREHVALTDTHTLKLDEEVRGVSVSWESVRSVNPS